MNQEGPQSGLETTSDQTICSVSTTKPISKKNMYIVCGCISLVQNDAV